MKYNFFYFKTTDIRKIIKKIASMPKLKARKRIIVITRAEKPVLYCIGKLEIIRLFL